MRWTRFIFVHSLAQYYLLLICAVAYEASRSGNVYVVRAGQSLGGIAAALWLTWFILYWGIGHVDLEQRLPTIVAFLLAQGIFITGIRRRQHHVPMAVLMFFVIVLALVCLPANFELTFIWNVIGHGIVVGLVYVLKPELFNAEVLQNTLTELIEKYRLFVSVHLENTVGSETSAISETDPSNESEIV